MLRIRLQRMGSTSPSVPGQSGQLHVRQYVHARDGQSQDHQDNARRVRAFCLCRFAIQWDSRRYPRGQRNNDRSRHARRSNRRRSLGPAPGHLHDHRTSSDRSGRCSLEPANAGLCAASSERGAERRRDVDRGQSPRRMHLHQRARAATHANSHGDSEQYANRDGHPTEAAADEHANLPRRLHPDRPHPRTPLPTDTPTNDASTDQHANQPRAIAD